MVTPNKKNQLQDLIMNMDFKLPENLPGAVAKKYEEAKSSDALVFSKTECTSVQDSSGITWQLQYSAGIKHKPCSNDPKPSNPFDNPSPALLITPLPPTGKPTHNLLLNKFPIIRGHTILTTAEYASQSSPLEQVDLQAAYAILHAFSPDSPQPQTNGSAGPNHTNGDTGSDDDANKGELFGFFNSGPASGASQAHRHIQLLPIREMSCKDDAACAAEKWEPLITQLARDDDESSSERLGIELFIERLSPGASAEEIYRVYRRLFEKGRRVLGMKGEWSKEEKYSYNLGFTRGEMALCPRTRGDATLEKGEEVGFNGAMLAGTILVKDQEQFDVLSGKKGGELMSDMVRQVGVLYKAKSNI